MNILSVENPHWPCHIELTALIGVRLDIPVSVHIARLVLLDTGSLNLLETPLRQVDITSP